MNIAPLMKKCDFEEMFPNKRLLGIKNQMIIVMSVKIKPCRYTSVIFKKEL